MIELIRQTETQRRDLKLHAVRDRSIPLDGALLDEVSRIIDDVRRRGDRALIDCAARFDGVRIEASDLRVDAETIRRTALKAEPEVIDALREAIGRVRAFHEHEIETSWSVEKPNGVRLGQRIAPLDRVGVYVPGGSACYPSSVIMNVVPAQIAGVKRIVVATPPGSVAKSPVVAAAILELNVTEVYAVGGAQAIAALAFGTETIPRVDKITGPGNRYVAAAKKLVFGAVGIDSIAGPSEVVIIADEIGRPDFIAADLLAQAEHDSDASAILITTSEALAIAVRTEVERQAGSLPRLSIVNQSLSRFGAIFVVASLDEACEIANSLAPEHLQLITADAERVAARIRHAGAIFFGEQTPEIVGDYIAGPNHVLPTSGTARFSSALGVADFVKRTSMLRFSSDEMRRTATMIAALARAKRDSKRTRGRR